MSVANVTVGAVGWGVEFYAKPEGEIRSLSVRPELASWDRAGSPSQERLAVYLEHAKRLVAPELARVDGPVSLRLDVGVPHTVSLLDERDLDNYLYPLMLALDWPGDVSLRCGGTKRYADSSALVVAAARVGTDDRDWAVTRSVATDASSSTTAFKEQINQQLLGVTSLAPGPVILEVGYRVGPSRYGPNLWKPTIDALALILGRTRADRPWHPLDGRIVSLGLHRTVDPTLGTRVRIVIRAATAESP
jgi:hypothetical protein